MPDRANLLYAAGGNPDDKWFDIGYEVNIRFTDDHGYLGLIVAHPPGPPGKSQIDGWCYGSITTNPQSPTDWWHLISRYPLTLSPSLKCSCGHHGWIENWRWRKEADSTS